MPPDPHPLPARFDILRGEVRLPAPPTDPELRDPGWLVTAIPVMGIAVMAIFYVLRAITEPANSALFAIPLLILALFTVAGTVLAQRWRRRDYQRQRDENALKYLRSLHSQRVRLQAARDVQTALLEHFFPEPRKHLALLLDGTQSLPIRHPESPDFALTRLGIGRVPLSIRITVPDVDLNQDAALPALELADEYRYLGGVPLVLSLLQHAPFGIEGRRTRALGLVRAVLAGLFMSHLPDALQIVVLAPQTPREDWAWLRWTPHTRNGQWLALDPDAARRVTGSLGQLVDTRQQTGGAHLPHVLVIVDGAATEGSRALVDTILRDGRAIGVSALCIGARREDLPADCRTVLALEEDGTLHYAGARDNDLSAGTAQADRLSLSDAEAAARAIARAMEVEEEQGGQIPRHIEFLDLYDIETVEQIQRMIHGRWQRDVPDGVLPFPVPIGRENIAETLWLALDEEHHGPHGMLAGTTGAGKSELLQTLICALAVEHHPQYLNFLLIDFKGGSTFNVFRDLPHTVGMVTNLDGALIERVLEALKSETEERQRYFKQVNVRDITQYHRLRNRQMNLPPVPHLFVIVDEFAQLAREMPDFLSELVRTAQVGRSLGLHLILGTQSPRDVITDEMNANLQFRICLRVQNVEASRAMLRRPDAAYLPSGWAGRGFLQVGERDLFRQFQTAYSGGDYRTDGSDSRVPVLELIADSGQTYSLVAENSRKSGADDAPESTARAVVRMIADYAVRHQVNHAPALLLPPLDVRITLEDVFARAGAGGWDGREWQSAGVDQSGEALRVGSAPIGLLDDLAARQQPPLWIHLNTQPNRISEKDGHLLIVGGPGSGKTTVLRTLALSLAHLHQPDDLHLYLLSFTGGALSDLGNRLPHAERLIAGTESERVRRLFRRLLHVLEQRQTNQQPAHPTIVLMIDQYEQFRDTYYEQHMPEFERLISEGRSAGIFIVMTANSIGALPDRIRSLVHQRIALRLADSGDYLLTVGAYAGRADQPLLPGRGFVYHTPPLPCQISLPVLHLALEEDAMRQAIMQQATAMQQAYRLASGRTQAPEPIAELAARIVLESLPAPEARARIVTPLGYSDDDRLSLFQLDWWEQGPHFIVTGAPASGKTNLLHAAILQAARQHPPEALRFVLVDFTGRSLRHLAKLKHVLAHVTDQDALVDMLRDLRAEMQLFAQVEQAQGERASLPRTVLVIDDYDLFSDTLATLPDVLRELRDHARLHSALGLHVWAAGYFERISDPLMRQILMQRCGFALGSREGLYHFNLRTTGLPAEVLPPGRAFFVQYNRLQIIQTALVDDALYYVYGCNNNEAPPARWIAQSADLPPDTQQPAPALPDLEIDTAGLIADLLGGEGEDDA